MSNVCSLLYLPRPGVGEPAAALANLNNYKRKWPLVIYSDHKWHPSSFDDSKGPLSLHKCENPERVKDEIIHHCPKFIYLLGLRIVAELGFDHFLTLECDSRVHGDFWDEALFDEFFTNECPSERLLGGTMFSWSPYNDDLDSALEFEDFFMRCQATAPKAQAIRVPSTYIYGGRGSCERGMRICYPNGCLSVAQTAFAQRSFQYRNIYSAATEGPAWDPSLGQAAFIEYGVQAYRRLVPMHRCFSTYGDLLSNEGLRRELLMSGQVVAVHQIKSSFVP